MSAATTVSSTNDDEKECCPICLEELPDQSIGKQLVRFICCGKVLCGHCASLTQANLEHKREELLARLADGGTLPDVFNEDTCPMCRTPHAQTDEEKFATIMKHAQAGKAWAQYQLADAYEEGMGTPVNYKSAMEWHTTAAEQGFAPSMWALGLIYLNARCGQSTNIRLARKWLEKGAAKKNAGAMCALAYHYFGVANKPREGKELLDASVEMQFPYAEYLVATNYHQGVLGYPKNKDMAIMFYKRAALQNNDMAQFNLAGTLYQDRNIPSALFWWRLVAHNNKSTQQAEAIRVCQQLEAQMRSKCAACAKPEAAAKGDEPAMLRCAACQVPWYCNKNCQVFHWKLEHKVYCKQVQDLKKEMEEAKIANYYFGESPSR